MNRDDVTFALALLGSVLGVIGIWREFDRDRVKLRVTPKVAYPVNMHDDRPRLCIDVINLSAFPVTVREVGFTVWLSRHRLAIISPLLVDGKAWPRRLEPRESLTAYCSPDLASDVKLAAVRRAYAKTDCDETRYGKSKALSAYIAKHAQKG
jgi:hypothetical protein